MVVDDGTDLETVSERLRLLAIGRGEASRERRRGMAAGSGKSRGRHMPLGFQGGDTVAGPRAGGPRVGPGEGGGRVGPRRIVEGWHWAADGRAQEGGCGHLLARPSAPAWARARRTREWTRGMPGPTGLGREGGWGRWWAGWAKK